MKHADYYIEVVTPVAVFIVDEDRGGKSVTNDAEWVVEQVNRRFPNHRIIYQDTEGHWDELVHDNGIFKDFKFLPSEEFRTLYNHKYQ